MKSQVAQNVSQVNKDCELSKLLQVYRIVLWICLQLSHQISLCISPCIIRD